MPSTRPKVSLLSKAFRDSWIRGLGECSAASIQDVEQLDRLFNLTWLDGKLEDQRALLLLEHVLATIAPAWLERVGMYATAKDLRAIAAPAVECMGDALALLVTAAEKLHREKDSLQGVYIPGLQREHDPKREVDQALREAGALSGLSAACDAGREAWARWTNTCWRKLWPAIHDVTWTAMRVLCYQEEPRILVSGFYEAYEKARRVLTPTAEAQFRTTLAVYRSLLCVGRAA